MEKTTIPDNLSSGDDNKDDTANNVNTNMGISYYTKEEEERYTACLIWVN